RSSLIESEQFDAAAIQEKWQSINTRFERVKNLAAHRQSRLNEAFTLHQFFRDIADQESRIKEKKLFVGSGDFGRDLTGEVTTFVVQFYRNLSRSTSVWKLSCRARASAGSSGGWQQTHGHFQHLRSEIESRLKALSQAWSELKAALLERGEKLEQSLVYQQFLAKVEEEEAWISEKQQLLVVDDLGDSMAAVQGLLKKHDAFETDNEINDLANTMISSSNHHALQIEQRVTLLHQKMDSLAALVNKRKHGLFYNSAYLQFMWKADVMESSIADKETHVKSEEFRRDLTLLTKQDTFDAGLNAFESEGIANIRNLKDQLIESNHVQSGLITKRFEDVVTRWKNLLAASNARKTRLLHMQELFRQIEELYLTFAKKNAEEDLTDPVRCNSIEEIRALREAHAQFQASLSSAEADFQAVGALDKQIKSFNVGPNPYTWFTMEALEETWRKFRRSSRSGTGSRQGAPATGGERQAQEGVCQDCQRVSLLVDRDQIVNDGRHGNVGAAAGRNEAEIEVRARRSELKKIENLGAILEEHLILIIGTLSTARWGWLRRGISLACGCSTTSSSRSYGGGKPARPEFEAILDSVDPNRDGNVSLQEYMAFMISKETENVQSSEEIEKAFRAITSRERGYVTREELYSNLTKEMTDYCVSRMKPYVGPKTGHPTPGALDYVDFTHQLFQS
ncbi:Spectrin alpha chain, partial [Orchesella cincta]